MATPYSFLPLEYVREPILVGKIPKAAIGQVRFRL